MAARSSDFPGFSRDLVRFLRELERNNRKAWFDAHRAEYDALFLEPAKAFALAMGDALPAVGRDVRSDPRVNGSIMRINRDTRFSKDKTPYKTAMHFTFGTGSGKVKDGAGFYLRIAPGGMGVAAGKMGLTPAELARFRAAVVDPKRGAALRSALDKVRKAGPYELPEPALKRVPPGFDAEHRNAEWLRHKSFYVHAEGPLPKALFGKGAVSHVIDRFIEMRPVQAWLARAVEA